MLCIKYSSNTKPRLKEKFSIIHDIISILPTQRKLEIYWSDYTFSKVPESQVFSFIQDTIMDNEAILDNKNSDKFISILITLDDNKKIQIEITPPKARSNKRYLPHIEFSFCDEDACLFTYFKNTKKINQLIRVLNKYNASIDEIYFYDPLSGLDCYSDISNRLWQKRNDSKSFTEDLLKIMNNGENNIHESEVEEDTKFNLAFNFTNFLYQPDGIIKLTNIISRSQLKVTASAGSIILSGQDVSELIILLKQKLKSRVLS